MLRLALFAALAFTCTVAADDDAKPDAPKPKLSDKKIDWGAYTDHLKLAGKIDKVSEAGFTLAVPKRGGNGRPTSEKIDLAWHDNGLARWAKEPIKYDAKGKKTRNSEKERRELKLPPGAPGYAADRADLAADTLVEVHLLKPKGIAADKLVTTDYKVKFVIIQDTPPAREEPATKPKK